MRRLAFAVLSLCLAATLAAYAAPAIHVEEPIHDFGEVLEGYAVEHTFTIQNIGDEVLEITSVRISCGCTKTDLETDHLEPGQSVTLGVTVNTTGFGGRISKSVYIYSSDPSYADSTESDLPPYTLRITGMVNRAEEYHITTYDLNYLYYTLIDVRDATAYASGHLLGAINIPFDEFEESIVSYPTDAWYIVYDQDGTNGDAAARMLQQMGFATVHSILGGLDDWIRRFDSLYLDPVPENLEKHEREAVFNVDLSMMVDQFKYVFYLLIDVRDEEAYEASHLLGAINVPQAQVEQWIDPFRRDVMVVLYDQANAKSDAAVQLLALHNFSRARSLLGGFEEWMRNFADRFVVTAE